MRLLITLTLLVNAAVAGAQGTGTIAPGMTRAKVVAALGAPTTERTVAEFRYLFYQNSCGKECGMNDLVVLDSNKVVDAVFRSAARKYAGTSSSPRAIPADEARRGTSGGQLYTPPKKPDANEQTSQREAQP